MPEITTNADELAVRYRERAAALLPALRKHVRRAALLVERGMVKRLSGGGAPWSYPVPVRTGFLRRSTFVQQPQPVLAIVGNSARYAHAIHSGNVSQWAGRGEHRMVQRQARPYLDDAVEEVDPAGIVQVGIREALGMAL